MANWGTNCPPIVKICVPKIGDASSILLASYRARLSFSEMKALFFRIGGQTVPQLEYHVIAKITHCLIMLHIAIFHFSLTPADDPL